MGADRHADARRRAGADAADTVIDALPAAMQREIAAEQGRLALAQGLAQARMQQMLDRAIDARPDAVVSRCSGPEWFAAATTVIGELHGLEKDMVARARAATEARWWDKATEMSARYLPMLALARFATWLRPAAATGMTGPKRWIATRFGALADGDVDSPIRPGADDELGQIAGAMNGTARPSAPPTPPTTRRGSKPNVARRRRASPGRAKASGPPTPARPSARR